MKILITGAKGFIGSKLSVHLKKKHEVYTLDQYISDEENYFRSDVSIFYDLKDIFEKTSFDLVIHLAAECGIENCEEHVEKSIRTNIVGTYNIIKLCQENKIKLIYFSTSEIYGDLDKDKMSEDINISLLQPRNHYALQKLFGEKMIIKELKDYIIVRPFMVYGVGENLNKYRSVISKFINLSQKNCELPVHKDSYRSWTHIDDFIEAIEILIESKSIGTYNVGNDENIISIEDLAKIIINKLNRGKIIFTDVPSVRTKYKIGDFTKLKKLGFKPKINLEIGVDEIIKEILK